MLTSQATAITGVGVTKIGDLFASCIGQKNPSIAALGADLLVPVPDLAARVSRPRFGII